MYYYTYMLRCVDNTFYTGYTADVEKRLVMHNHGRGAKYTRSRLPVELVWSKAFPSKHAAMYWEWQIKRWPRRKKELLFTNGRFILEKAMENTNI